jgi:hypothetical protein
MKKTVLGLLCRVVIVAILGASSYARAGMYTAQAGVDPEPVSGERWSSFLPLMADEAKERGYELPLPFGVSAVLVTLLNRQVKVNDVRVGLNGAPPSSVSRFLDLGSTSDIVFNANLKADAWLLPFMNLYLLLGYVYNKTTTHADITLPGNINFTREIKTTLDGFVGGGGMTLAGGYNDFFMVFDANWSQTDIGFDDRFRAIIATVRAGWNGKVASYPLQLWLGEGYWNTENTAKSTVNVPGVGRIEFEADQGPRYLWMTDVGANLEIAKNFQTVLDFGFDYHGGYFIVLAPTYRF